MTENKRDRQTDSATRRIVARSACGIAIVASVFVLTVSVLLTVNALRTHRAAPLDSPALVQLQKQLREHPQDDELRAQLRDLDLLARRAFFTSQAFAQRGRLLLFGGVVVMLGALQAMNLQRRGLPILKRLSADEGGVDPAAVARWAVGIAGVGFLATAVGLPLVLRTPHISDPAYPLPVAPLQPAQAASARPPASRQDFLRNWPFFRGPDGNGVAFCTKAPDQWDGPSGKGIRWKTPIPRPGYNSPIVWDNHVFLTGGDTEAREVFCFDADTGELRWRHVVAGIPGSPTQLPEVTDDTGYAAPTAATDGRAVYAIFATGDILALDFDGNRLWARNLGVPENHYGHSSSLIVHGNLLLVQYDHAAECSLLALATDTGETVWRELRDIELSWASPIVVDTGGRTEIILNASPYVVSYDANSGVELWNLECMGGEVAPSPAYADGLVFVANEYALLAAINVNDGTLAWDSPDVALPDVASPLATEQYVFLPSSSGIVTCLDAKCGEVFWEHSFPAGFYGSPILVGNRIYAIDRRGIMRIFRASKTFALLGEPALGETVVTTPAFTDGRIYIRGMKHLYCIALDG